MPTPRGVPMGGNRAGDTAPQILVWAIKDPIGPGLDRIQIVNCPGGPDWR